MLWIILVVYGILALGVFCGFLGVLLLMAASSPGTTPTELIGAVCLAAGLSLIWPLTVWLILYIWIKG